jgi:hypothetical protein
MFGLQCYPHVHLLGYTDRMLTRLFSVLGLYYLAYIGGELCTGVRFRGNVNTWVFPVVACFFVKGRDI